MAQVVFPPVDCSRQPLSGSISEADDESRSESESESVSVEAGRVRSDFPAFVLL
jgi:hypothetical protein